MFEIIDYTEVNPEENLGWDLIIFGLNGSYGHSKLIANTDDLDKIKKLLEIFNIDPQKYFK